jgi:hypothetical protein
VALAEVDPGDDARLAMEGDQDGRPADLRALRRVHRIGGLDDESGGLEIAHHGGDRGRCERGPAREIGARNGTGLGQDSDDSRACVAA